MSRNKKEDDLLKKVIQGTRPSSAASKNSDKTLDASAREEIHKRTVEILSL